MNRIDGVKRASRIIAIYVAIVFLSIYAASARTRSAPVAQTASVKDSISVSINKFRSQLISEKARAEKEIVGFEIKEATYGFSGEGVLIDEASGGGVVKATHPVGTPMDTLNRIAFQLYRGAIIVILYTLDHSFVIYLLLALILYRIVRWSLHIFLRR